MKIYAYTQIGRGRKTNEDRHLIRRNGKASFLAAVIDGLGGETAGDYAAQFTRDALYRSVGGVNDERRLSDIIKEADRLLRKKAEADDDFWGMGAAVTCVCFFGSQAHWVHVGDSRLYLFRNHELRQITRDQTMARFLVEEGEMTEAEARTHDARHHLEQCVGCGGCDPDLGNFRIEPGDLFLLTTDGIHGLVPDETISLILSAKTELEIKALSLSRAALDVGGNDDMTVLIARVED